MEIREIFEWLRFLVGAAFLLAGVSIFVIEMIGVFRFRYVLNRMHAVAMGDTLGIGACLLGLMVMSGISFTSLKFFAVIVFLWFSSPVSSHLVARLEVATDEEREKHYRVKDMGGAPYAGVSSGNMPHTGGEQEGEP